VLRNRPIFEDLTKGIGAERETPISRFVCLRFLVPHCRPHWNHLERKSQVRIRKPEVTKPSGREPPSPLPG
jgi:hypothetical protein